MLYIRRKTTALGCLIGLVLGVSPAQAQEATVRWMGQQEASPVTREIVVDNCDNDQGRTISFHDRFNFSTLFKVSSGWSVSPGLSVNVPKFGTVSLTGVLSQDYEIARSQEQNSVQQMQEYFPPKRHISLSVTVQDTFRTGVITVEKKKFLGIASDIQSSRFEILRHRRVDISRQDRGCLTGTWKYHSWNERPGRQGVGNILYLPQTRYMGEWNFLRVDDAGIAQWDIIVSPPSIGGQRIILHCTGRIDEATGNVTTTGVTWDYQNVASQVDPREAGEFSYALCGQGLSYRTGRNELAYFHTRLLTQTAQRTLEMSNSQGTFRWLRQGP